MFFKDKVTEFFCMTDVFFNSLRKIHKKNITFAIGTKTQRLWAYSSTRAT